MILSKLSIKKDDENADSTLELLQSLKKVSQSHFNSVWDPSDSLEHILDNIENRLITYLGYVSPLTFTSDTPEGLSIAALNVRSLQKNESKVISFLEYTNLNVLALQEVWTSDGNIPNYKSVLTLRQNKRGG